MATPYTPSEMRNKIDKHLEKGAGIYAFHPSALGERYFKARVSEGRLEVWSGFSWFEVPRGTQFNNGHGSAGNLFVY
ncbi:hypothetical protein [Pseudomonas psychrophila]|uniref:Uncharacterized protein n=1 Tax=Pseudomonas psychrophila TaxID=122355 RepID=A0A8I1FRJ4_9PSED|nr:hypothetical protein [Pseudomonas psychrophila]AVX93429.1 hypothetical protein PkP19E3_35680 [Pseudomonas koreensis]MBJ2259476.1 hypothetical protein [Pseudomonas psychrophila]